MPLVELWFHTITILWGEISWICRKDIILYASFGQPAWNPGYIIPDEVFSQDFIPKFQLQIKGQSRTSSPHPPAVARFLWFQWSLAAVGSDKWSLGALSGDRRLIQLVLSLLQALIFVVILGWIFVPIYIKAGVSQTTPLHLSLLLRAGILPGIRNSIIKSLWMARDPSVPEQHFVISEYLKNEDSLF